MSDVITSNIDIWTSALLSKSSVGRGSNGKQEVYGVKKLRELILKLAIVGRLVPQLDEDEPAGSRLAAARSKLRSEGKGVRRSAWQESAPVSAEEQKFALPRGWAWARVNDTGFYVNGLAFKPTDWGASGRPIIRIQNLTDPTKPLNYAQGDFPEVVTVRSGDLLVSWSATLDCFIWDREEAVLNQHIFKVSPCHELTTHKFLYWLLKFSIREMEEGDHAHGLVMAHINREPFLAHVVAIPPIAEQERIVAKLDELMALCDRMEQQQAHSVEAHKTLVEVMLAALASAVSPQELTETWTRIASNFDTLFITEASIDRLKQTILQLAVMGRLVPQDPNDEPASVLVKAIAAEKALLAKEGRTKKETREVLAARALFGLPNGWTWSELADLLAVVTDGDHQAPPQSDEGTPFLVIGNLNTGVIDFGGCKFVPTEYYEKLDWGRRPVAGDLLYTVTGSFGIPVLVNTERHFCVQRHVAILKATRSTPRRYLALVLASKFAIEYATGIATGIAQKTVPLTGLRRMPIPVPPAHEQHRIVARVDELMALCDALKALVADAQTTNLHLADAIVEQAVA